MHGDTKYDLFRQHAWRSLRDHAAGQDGTRLCCMNASTMHKASAAQCSTSAREWTASQQVARSCCYTSQRAGHAASSRDRLRTPCIAMQHRNAWNGRAAQAPAPYNVGGVPFGPPVQQQARHVQAAHTTRPHQGCASKLQVQQGATYAAVTKSSPQQVQPKDAHEQSHTRQPCSSQGLRPAWDAWGYKV